MDPRGQTIGNPIVIEVDNDEVTLVDAPGMVYTLIPINDEPDGSD